MYAYWKSGIKKIFSFQLYSQLHFMAVEKKLQASAVLIPR